MLQIAILPVVRHFVGMFGGVLAERGWASDNDATLISGAIITLITIGWSIIEKMLKAKQG